MQNRKYFKKQKHTKNIFYLERASKIRWSNTSDGSFLTWVGSNFWCSGWVGSVQVSHIWFKFGFGKFPLKIPNFPTFCPLDKKNLIGSGQKGLYFTAGQKYARVRSGPISIKYLIYPIKSKPDHLIVFAVHQYLLKINTCCYYLLRTSKASNYGEAFASPGIEKPKCSLSNGLFLRCHLPVCHLKFNLQPNLKLGS